MNRSTKVGKAYERQPRPSETPSSDFIAPAQKGGRRLSLYEQRILDMYEHGVELREIIKATGVSPAVLYTLCGLNKHDDISTYIKLLRFHEVLRDILANPCRSPLRNNECEI